MRVADVLAVVAGVAFGILGSIPGGWLAHGTIKHQRRYGIGQGLASVLVSMVLLTMALGGCWILSRDRFVPFACALLVAFTAIWVYEAARAWRWISGHAGDKGSGQ